MEKLGTQAKQSMVRRSLIGLVIGLIYVSVILAGYYIDRVVGSVFLCIVGALSVLEVRDALETEYRNSSMLWCGFLRCASVCRIFCSA